MTRAVDKRFQQWARAVDGFVRQAVPDAQCGQDHEAMYRWQRNNVDVRLHQADDEAVMLLVSGKNRAASLIESVDYLHTAARDASAEIVKCLRGDLRRD